MGILKCDPVPILGIPWGRGPCRPCGVSKGLAARASVRMYCTCGDPPRGGIPPTRLKGASGSFRPALCLWTATSLGTPLPSLTAHQAGQSLTTLQVGPAAARGRDE